MEAKTIRSKEVLNCYHYFVEDDALYCVFCGYSKYPEVLDFYSKYLIQIVGRMTRNKNNQFMVGFLEFPYVRYQDGTTSIHEDGTPYLGPTGTTSIKPIKNLNSLRRFLSSSFLSGWILGIITVFAWARWYIWYYGSSCS